MKEIYTWRDVKDVVDAIVEDRLDDPATFVLDHEEWTFIECRWRTHAGIRDHGNIFDCLGAYAPAGPRRPVPREGCSNAVVNTGMCMFDGNGRPVHFGSDERSDLEDQYVLQLRPRRSL